ncbi:Aste57867_15718 [Aphanomyces stellatus]|uniref:Aste57867_15718 protein n=1 Tax=Aphanomyces stellatus TaxID=120398 RepID=A0A485L4C0_9STRA|nr:hypothetical protein As57867_015662 [Aphanomyces stellatus]VFT92509.1 Aste57867_15718 [Aphanomyces stellatus]
MSGDQGSGGVPYIGSRISLISKTDIRYEGLLFNIDTRQSMVALQNVRSFGTEGRRPDHIPPSDTVLQYATFKASEIKDLHVCEAAAPPPLPSKHVAPPPPPMSPPNARMPPPTQAVAPPPLPQPHHAPPLPKQPTSYPAPPQYSQPPPPLPSAPRPASPKHTYAPAPAASTSTLLTPGAVSGSVPHAPIPSAARVQQRDNRDFSSRQNDHSAPLRQEPMYHDVNPPLQQSNARTIPGMGGHLLKRKERRVNNENGHPDSAMGGEFDFAGGLGDFDKEKEFSKLTVEESSSRPVVKSAYQKSSFFDTISCDALDRLEGNSGRMKAHEERKLNTETFGAVGLNNRRNYRGGNRNNGRSNGGNGGNGGNGYGNGQPGGQQQQRSNDGGGNGSSGNRRGNNRRSGNNGQQGQNRRDGGGNGRGGSRQNQPAAHAQHD